MFVVCGYMILYSVMFFSLLEYNATVQTDSPNKNYHVVVQSIVFTQSSGHRFDVRTVSWSYTLEHPLVGFLESLGRSRKNEEHIPVSPKSMGTKGDKKSQSELLCKILQVSIFDMFFSCDIFHIE